MVSDAPRSALVVLRGVRFQTALTGALQFSEILKPKSNGDSDGEKWPDMGHHNQEGNEIVPSAFEGGNKP